MGTCPDLQVPPSRWRPLVGSEGGPTTCPLVASPGCAVRKVAPGKPRISLFQGESSSGRACTQCPFRRTSRGSPKYLLLGQSRLQGDTYRCTRTWRSHFRQGDLFAKKRVDPTSHAWFGGHQKRFFSSLSSGSFHKSYQPINIRACGRRGNKVLVCSHTKAKAKETRTRGQGRARSRGHGKPWHLGFVQQCNRFCDDMHNDYVASIRRA